MSINSLPDDCLLYIFNFFSDFQILLNYAKVCERWKYLVLQRLSHVKYLADRGPLDCYPVEHTILYENLDDIDILEWFPKLKILTARGNKDFFSHLPIEGLNIADGDFEGITFNPSLKMLTINSYRNEVDSFANDILGPKLTQLYLCRHSISHFSKIAKYFPNLRRLHLERHTFDIFIDEFYTGPVFEHLQILEINFQSQYGGDYDYCGFSLADHCPALKSAYHLIDRNDEFTVNDSVKNHHLEDLVIQTNFNGLNWFLLRTILSKYPNLKHLAIRDAYDTEISNENIPEILQLLPNIVLIDIRNSPKVNESAIDYIEQYAKKHNRSISLHYQKRPKIAKKWPHLSTKSTHIGLGFDFMKHCFLKTNGHLPYLLDPNC